jgi:hypothetical protein
LPADHTGLPPFPDPGAQRVAWRRASGGWVVEVVRWEIPGGQVSAVAEFYDQAARRAGYVPVAPPDSAPASRPAGSASDRSTNVSNRVFLRVHGDGARLVVFVSPAGTHDCAALIQWYCPAPDAAR